MLPSRSQTYFEIRITLNQEVKMTMPIKLKLKIAISAVIVYDSKQCKVSGAFVLLISEYR